MAIEKLNPILRAAQFARQAHEGQRRKCNDRPYIEHPARVAARVTILPGATEAMVVAAWLHDVVEDTTVELDEIARPPQALDLGVSARGRRIGHNLPVHRQRCILGPSRHAQPDCKWSCILQFIKSNSDSAVPRIIRLHAQIGRSATGEGDFGLVGSVMMHPESGVVGRVEIAVPACDRTH